MEGEQIMKYVNHDTSAAEDEKLSELIIEFGYEGYGLFWAILEKLGKQEKPIKTVVLKRQLNVGKRLEKCWLFMESIGLICSSNGETFNKQLLNYAGKYAIKKEKNAERIAKWRDNQDYTENVTRYTDECNTPKEKESKEKEIKVNETLLAAVAAGGKSKAITPHWNYLKAMWIDFYKSKFQLEPTFNGGCSSALKLILTRLQQHSSVTTKTKDLPWTEDYAGKVFTHFLTKAYADSWRAQNFRLPILSSHYDSIITNTPHETGSNNGKQPTGANVDSASAFSKIATLAGGN